ncbi:hypothetical protein BH10PAT3_BH10PAT3_2680 [soil metagenome]
MYTKLNYRKEVMQRKIQKLSINSTESKLFSGILFSQLAVILASLIAPLLLLTGTASAAQLTVRSVAISDSSAGATATYLITFTTPATTNIGAVVVQNCTTALGTCTAPTGAANNVAATGTWTGTSATNFSRQVTTTGGCTIGANVWCGTRTTASETNGIKTLSIPSNTNQTPALGTFYLRITTFTDAAFTAPSTSGQDTGVVAASTAANLSVTARIQETLTFCVGTTSIDNATSDPGACPIGGTAVDLGTLTASAHNYSVPRTDGGTATNGIAMLSTNARLGSVVSYYANQNSSSGTLKVAGTACGASVAYSGGTKTDICINDTTTQTTFNTVPANEGFGMTVAGTNCGHTTGYSCVLTSGSNALKATSPYIGATATSYGTTAGFAWDHTGTTVQIASSTGVVDSEGLILKYDAWPVGTTPTGSYTVTSVYIATATY